MRVLTAVDRWLHRVMRGRCWCPWLCLKLEYYQAMKDAAIRERIADALYDSMDKCARCKVCDEQVDAVMAVMITRRGPARPAAPGSSA